MNIDVANCNIKTPTTMRRRRHKVQCQRQIHGVFQNVSGPFLSVTIRWLNQLDRTASDAVWRATCRVQKSRKCACLLLSTLAPSLTLSQELRFVCAWASRYLTYYRDSAPARWAAGSLTPLVQSVADWNSTWGSPVWYLKFSNASNQLRFVTNLIALKSVERSFKWRL